MVWPQRWRSIAARIDGLLAASDFLVQAFQANSSDTFGSVRSLLAEHAEIIEELKTFRSAYSELLPCAAKEALEVAVVIPTPQANAGGHGPAYITVVAQLSAFKSRFEYLISDREYEAQALTELSIEHLNRTIAVDERAAQSWKRAFTSGELACEKLGAVHLLHHGIWGFKVGAKGQATDLVYGDAISVARVARTARALVHTEWKLAEDQSSVDKKSSEAKVQAQLYQTGVLGDLELKKVRYLIIVSEKQLVMPDDLCAGRVTFRHLNVATAPEAASVAAKRIASRKK